MYPATIVMKGRPMGMRLPMETLGTSSNKSGVPPTFIPHEVKENAPLPAPKMHPMVSSTGKVFMMRDSAMMPVRDSVMP